ncbi:MAG: FtsX-like permease family protein, partial [Chitinophagaceae bacterium]
VIGALIVVFLCLPLINQLLDVHISTAILFNVKFIFFILLVFLLVTILSGFYPAIVLSGFRSINVLKSNANANKYNGISLRRALVVLQFVIAQSLIIGTLVVASQMDYFSKANLGFNKTAIVNAGVPGDSLSRTKVDFLKNELMKIRGVENVSFSTFSPTSSNGFWATDLRLPENTSKTPDMIIGMKPADTSFFKLYDLKIVAGRIYYPSDTMREFVVNETVVRKLGIAKAKDAIGKMIIVNGQTLPIVGVVKDFNVASLRDPIDPIVLTTIKRAYGMANIKINLKEAKPVLASLQQTWNKYFPDYVFEYGFLDQAIASFYAQENRLSDLYKIFSGIAIFISCLGLYGLISFMAVQRRKEIGIRKVLGAPVRDIVIMLSKEFTILIATAFLIAGPIAWYFMHHWLEQYTYRIPVRATFFVLTILCSLIIAWITAGYTTIKAAFANPVDSLRTE